MYDVVVLGGGNAGVAAAVKAAQLGARVALVNAGRLGAICVNVGCVPSKFLIRAAALKLAAERPHSRGLSAKVEVDGEALMAHMQEVVERLRKEKYEDVLAYYDVEVVEGYGRLKSTREAEVGGRVLEGKRIIVATGSRPRIPEIKGLQEAFRRGLTFTNEEFFSAGRMSSSVVFIGGGAVAVELAQALARLGVKTWIIYRSALLKYEEAASKFVEELLRKEGVGLVRDEATAVEVKDGGVKVRHTCGAVTAEAVFVATGRVPNVEPLGGLLRLGPTAGLR